MRRLKSAEVSTIVEGLRALQREPGHEDNIDVRLGDIEIDDLAEEINCSDVTLELSPEHKALARQSVKMRSLLEQAAKLLEGSYAQGEEHTESAKNLKETTKRINALLAKLPRPPHA